MKYETIKDLLEDKQNHNNDDLIGGKVMPSFTQDHTEYIITDIVHLMYVSEKASGLTQIEHIIDEYIDMRNSFVNPNPNRYLDIKPFKTKNDKLGEINIHINNKTYEHIYRKSCLNVITY